MSGGRGELVLAARRVRVRRAALQDPPQLLLVLRTAAAADFGQEPVHVRGSRRGDGVSPAALAHLLSLLNNGNKWRALPILYIKSYEVQVPPSLFTKPIYLFLMQTLIQIDKTSQCSFYKGGYLLLSNGPIGYPSHSLSLSVSSESSIQGSEEGLDSNEWPLLSFFPPFFPDISTPLWRWRRAISWEQQVAGAAAAPPSRKAQSSRKCRTSWSLSRRSPPSSCNGRG